MKLLQKLKRIAGAWIRFTYRCTYKWIPIDPKLVIFISFHGRGYLDNPKAIYEAMRNDLRFQGYRFIWFIKHKKKKNIVIPGAKVVEYFSIPYFYYLSRAKFWVINCKMPSYISKKPDQIYLQTWHGTPLKKLGHDIDVAENTTFYRSGMNFEEMTGSYDIDVTRYNYMISPNTFCTKVFQSAFGIDRQRLIETGYPRNDFLSNYTEDDVLRIKKKYNLPLDKKIVLYAPTWRDDSFVAAGYTFELQADFKKWKEALGEDTIVLFKPHYLIINRFDQDPSLKDFLYSIPAEAEISELYIVADRLVTDYSSVFFDYAILKRPIYFYMYDKEQYANNLRGFYLDIYKDLPGKIYEKEQDLLEALKKEEFDQERLSAFNALFNNREDGEASKRVLDVLAKDRME
ncbi:CDP-glycerol glycerophosphotransferase family protein [Dubosiella newyorkensis]|uniref:CDP-glycerol glycerophosphotransferase family protein n=1 Tax=Dubosiella newyorkensis TaxID=1862672 RepID=UPI002588A968|nr:CDP-glycerol glycerophosphotransferase family protein [Dubosiella newyorkensis]